MVSISSKYLILLLVVLSMVFFIGNYFDEAVQTFDYESYLLVDQGGQTQRSLDQNSIDYHKSFSGGFLNQLAYHPFVFPNDIELDYCYVLTSNFKKPFCFLNPPLLI